MMPFLLIDDQRKNPSIGKMLIEEYDSAETAQAYATKKAQAGQSTQVYTLTHTITPGVPNIKIEADVKPKEAVEATPIDEAIK